MTLYRQLLFLFVALIFSPAVLCSNDDNGAMAQLFHAQQQLAQSNRASAEYYLGEMYENGYGTPQNMDKAFEWYGKAAQQGYAEAKEKILNEDSIRTQNEAAKHLAAPLTPPKTKVPSQAKTISIAAVPTAAAPNRQASNDAAKLAAFKRRYAAYLKALANDRKREAYPME